MLSAGDVPLDDVPLDVKTIWQNCRFAPEAFLTLEEAETYGLILRGHVQLLLPEVERLVAGMPDDGSDLRPNTKVVIPRSGAEVIVRRAKGVLGQGFGDTILSAHWQVDMLAMVGRLLLLLVADPEDVPPPTGDDAGGSPSAFGGHAVVRLSQDRHDVD